ncbi:MAG: hypothetical protein ACJ71P_03850 [Nitrososphaeraceae archaeon]|jgi:hypothetical protein
MTISEEERSMIIQGVIHTVPVIMDKIISRKSPKSAARDALKIDRQSITAITRSVVFFNTLANVQQFPARPRDFRINFSEEEKNIRDSELSDILTSMVRQGFLQNKREKFPYPKGRPLADIKKSGIAEERRGSESYYEPSRIKELINIVLNDPKSIEQIDNVILKSEQFYRFLKYSFEVYLYQMNQNEKAFMDIMRAPIIKYGIGHKRLEELDSSYVFAKDLTREKIKRLSKQYAINTMNNFKEDGRNILHVVAGLFSLLNAYDPEKSKKESKT